MEERTFLEHWLILYQRKWLVVSVCIAAMMTAGIVSSVLTPVYEANAKFFVPSKPDVTSYLSKSDTTARSPLVPAPDDELYAPYIGILKSRTLRELVCQEIPQRTPDALRRDVDFSLSSQYIIDVYARDKDPLKAAGIANAYLRQLNRLLGNYSLESAARDQNLLEREILSVKEKLAQAKLNFESFQRNNRTAALEEERKDLTSLKMEFLAKLKTMTIEQNANEGKISALKEELQKEEALFAASNFYYTNPILEDLQRQLSLLEIRLSGLKADLRDSHPDIIAASKQREQIEKNISSEIDRLIKSQIKTPNTFYEQMRQQLVGLLVEKHRIVASIQASRSALESIEEKIDQFPELVGRADALKMEIEKYRGILQNLETKLEETKLQERREVQAIVIVEEALPPRDPIFPVAWLNVLVAGIAGLLAGILYCYFIYYLEETRDERVMKLLRAIETSRE